MDFEKRKALALAEMASMEADRSPKGTLDEPIVPLLNALNRHPSYFTTSSCSGRISVLSQPESAAAKAKKKKAGGGSWLFITHEPADPDSVVDILFRSSAPASLQSALVFRFEPFILAVECKNVPSAQLLVSSAISCGFRESGISSVQKRIMVAIRSSIRLEVPLGETNCLVVTPEYVRYLVRIANEKMEANRKRTDRFLQVLHGMVHLESRADTCHKFHASLANQEDSSNFNSRQCDIFSMEMVAEDRLTSAKVRNSSSCANGNRVDNYQRESPDCCLEKTSACNNFMEETPLVDSAISSDRVNGVTEACTQLEGCSFVNIAIHGEPLEKLFLWGHSACSTSNMHENQIFIFGGFGGLGRHARRGESLMLDVASGILKVINVDESPSPRIGHSSSAVGASIFIIGGRSDPTHIMNDVWILHTDQNRWETLECVGSLFHPRHRHATAAAGSKLYVFGGLNNDLIYNCMHVLDTMKAHWDEVKPEGEWPCARHSHSMVAYGSQLFMFGGFDGKRALGDLYSFDVETCIWKKVMTIGKTNARFSHSMFVYGQYIGILGGCPVTKNFEEVALLDLKNFAWKHVAIHSVSRELFVRSTACIVGGDLVLIGGGASCYAFGTKFNGPMKVNLHSLLFSAGFPLMEIEHVIEEVREKRSVGDFFHVTADKMLLEKETIKSIFDGREPLVLILNKKIAKVGKDLLKDVGWLDLTRKVYACEDGINLCVPIAENSYSFLRERLIGSKDAIYESNGVHSLDSRKNFSINEARYHVALKFLSVSGFYVRIDDVVNAKKAIRTPQKILREAVCSLIEKKRLPLWLLDQLPTRWEKLGDIVILPVSSFTDRLWDDISDELWPIVAVSLGAKRLAHQGRIMPNGTRDSSLKMLLGSNGWVDHHENGIIYSFDSTKCMFSFGNLSEKLRMAQLNCANETIVDLFAGIGYFVLPFLVKAKAKLVYACEWNPFAIEALRFNLQANFVSSRCVILEGDNRVTTPIGVADRVCLGLLPTSESSWATAVRALRPTGGILHVHGNVKDSEEDMWCDYVVKSFEEISRAEGHYWDISLMHLERVKWYGPRIRHVVLDIRCKQIQV